MVEKRRRFGIGPINEFIDKHGLREKFEALNPPNVAEVIYLGKAYKFYMPDAMQDKRQLPPRVGQFHELSYLKNFAKEVDPNGVLLDLGANFGSHTLFFASVIKAQHVHAFEPQAHLATVIAETLRLNDVTNVTLHQAAAGAKPGTAHIKKTNSENSGMAEFRPGQGSRTVPMIAVDDIVEDARVTGVKIDVEGMQMPVLRGMSKTIRRCRPLLWIELRPRKGEIAKPSEWLAERGYKRRQLGFRDFLFEYDG